jgi:HD-like signal output (HDOD) protein/CheY-like chemotaxis protein
MRVLFVDDDQNVLDAMARMMRSMRDIWDVDLAGSGQEALQKLAMAPFDVVVSDMRMANMTGAELLEIVRDRYPEVMRFVLSGQMDRDAALRSANCAHQFLSKPCDADQLKQAIARAAKLTATLQSHKMRALVTKLRSLPTLPALYHRVVEEINKSDPSLALITQIIEQDVGMTAKILQMVNSAFFGCPRAVGGVSDAVSLLGLDTLKALVTAAHVFGLFEESDASSFDLGSLERHSLRCGAIASRIAEAQNLGLASIARALMAGILHDIGRVVLATGLPAAYEGVLKTAAQFGQPWQEWEVKLLGAGHAEVGGYLLGLWGFPNDLVEAVTYHSSPASCNTIELSLAGIVHAAGAIEVHGATGCEFVHPLIDISYFEGLGLNDRLDRWREQFKPAADTESAVEDAEAA